MILKMKNFPDRFNSSLRTKGQMISEFQYKSIKSIQREIPRPKNEKMSR